MPVTPNTITLDELATTTISGTGVFDRLMKSASAHLDQEFTKGRIKGTEYASVYLGSMQAAMQYAVQFVLSKEKQNLDALLVAQQIDNAVKEGTVLVAQECKLRAEYDLTLETKLKTASETALLNQKKVTEQAQTADVAAPNSVIGKQMSLYGAQAEGFAKDAAQKKGDLYVKAWATARTTDPDNTPITTINTKLDSLPL